MKRINIYIEDDIYHYLLYIKGDKYAASFSKEIRDIINSHIKTHKPDKDKLESFLESKGIESNTMREERIDREKKLEKLNEGMDDVF